MMKIQARIENEVRCPRRNWSVQNEGARFETTKAHKPVDLSPAIPMPVQLIPDVDLKVMFDA